MDAQKVIAFGRPSERVHNHSVAVVVPTQNHLGILVSAYDFIGPWLAKCIEGATIK